jgi:hypothetical protein
MASSWGGKVCLGSEYVVSRKSEWTCRAVGGGGGGWGGGWRQAGGLQSGAVCCGAGTRQGGAKQSPSSPLSPQTHLHASEDAALLDPVLPPAVPRVQHVVQGTAGRRHLEEEHARARAVVGRDGRDPHALHLHGYVQLQRVQQVQVLEAQVVLKQPRGDGRAEYGARGERPAEADGVVRVEVREEVGGARGALELEAIHKEAGAGDPLDGLNLAGHAGWWRGWRLQGAAPAKGLAPLVRPRRRAWLLPEELRAAAWGQGRAGLGVTAACLPHPPPPPLPLRVGEWGLGVCVAGEGRSGERRGIAGRGSSHSAGRSSGPAYPPSSCSITLSGCWRRAPSTGTSLRCSRTALACGSGKP